MSSAISTQALRETFLEYFQQNGHLKIDGTSLIPPAEDGTLLLINSGMAPLKPYFTGERQPPSVRLCNVQSCIRTVDIGDVGDDTHLTFFEMLGNWSIGDYDREEAVDFASRLVIDHLGLPAEKLYASVYAGNRDINVPFDSESHVAWQKNGFPESRIVALGDEDNFWGPAGETGPCGPCTELFIDNGESRGPSYEKSGNFDTVRRYTEIWNAGVFMTFNKVKDGSLQPLPFKSVDSGAGLERMTMALNGLSSVYDVGPYPDLLAAVPNGVDKRGSRILADHMRASAHIISDGVYPDKAGRGYVVRRLLRRMETAAMSHGVVVPYDRMLDIIVEYDGANYKKLGSQFGLVSNAMKAEAASFQKVLRTGARAIQKCLAKSPAALDAKSVFDIVTSVGMPIESVQQIANASGASVDIDGFNTLMDEHRNKSRNPLPPEVKIA
jgi:alanyl-tRNA synthetase